MDGLIIMSPSERSRSSEISSQNDSLSEIQSMMRSLRVFYESEVQQYQLVCMSEISAMRVELESSKLREKAVSEELSETRSRFDKVKKEYETSMRVEKLRVDGCLKSIKDLGWNVLKSYRQEVESVTAALILCLKEVNEREKSQPVSSQQFHSIFHGELQQLLTKNLEIQTELSFVKAENEQIVTENIRTSLQQASLLRRAELLDRVSASAQLQSAQKDEIIKLQRREFSEKISKTEENHELSLSRIFRFLAEKDEICQNLLWKVKAMRISAIKRENLARKEIKLLSNEITSLKRQNEKQVSNLVSLNAEKNALELLLKNLEMQRMREVCENQDQRNVLKDIYDDSISKIKALIDKSSSFSHSTPQTEQGFNEEVFRLMAEQIVLHEEIDLLKRDVIKKNEEVSLLQRILAEERGTTKNETNINELKQVQLLIDQRAFKVESQVASRDHRIKDSASESQITIALIGSRHHSVSIAKHQQQLIQQQESSMKDISDIPRDFLYEISGGNHKVPWLKLLNEHLEITMNHPDKIQCSNVKVSNETYNQVMRFCRESITSLAEGFCRELSAKVSSLGKVLVQNNYIELLLDGVSKVVEREAMNSIEMSFALMRCEADKTELQQRLASLNCKTSESVRTAVERILEASSKIDADQMSTLNLDEREDVIEERIKDVYTRKLGEEVEESQRFTRDTNEKFASLIMLHRREVETLREELAISVNQLQLSLRTQSQQSSPPENLPKRGKSERLNPFSDQRDGYQLKQRMNKNLMSQPQLKFENMIKQSKRKGLGEEKDNSQSIQHHLLHSSISDNQQTTVAAAQYWKGIERMVSDGSNIQTELIRISSMQPPPSLESHRMRVSTDGVTTRRKDKANAQRKTEATRCYYGQQQQGCGVEVLNFQVGKNTGQVVGGTLRTDSNKTAQIGRSLSSSGAIVFGDKRAVSVQLNGQPLKPEGETVVVVIQKRDVGDLEFPQEEERSRRLTIDRDNYPARTTDRKNKILPGIAHITRLTTSIDTKTVETSSSQHGANQKQQQQIDRHFQLPQAIKSSRVQMKLSALNKTFDESRQNLVPLIHHHSSSTIDQ